MLVGTSRQSHLLLYFWFDGENFLTKIYIHERSSQICRLCFRLQKPATQSLWIFPKCLLLNFIGTRVLEKNFTLGTTVPQNQETSQVSLTADNAFLQKSCSQTEWQTIRVFAVTMNNMQHIVHHPSVFVDKTTQIDDAQLQLKSNVFIVQHHD